MSTRPHLLDGLHVLLVEDNVDALDVMTAILGHLGAVVTPVDRARKAMEHLGQVMPDAVVSDIAMPEHDGYWLISQIRSMPRGNGLPTIAVTARTDPAERRAILAAGFDAYLPKPVEIDDLLAAIIKLVERRGSGAAARD